MSEHDFPSTAIAGAYSGFLLGASSELHEAIEAMAGCPVWTHQLPRVMGDLKPKLAEALPALLGIDFDGITSDNVQARVAEIEALLGKTVRLNVPLVAMEADPFRDLPEGKPVVVVTP